QNWANTQPDYFPENYLRDFMDSHKSYEESWNSAVKSLRILVVNDQMRNVNYLISAAEENPLVTVKWATSVREALELLEKKPYDYDVVLTDWVMYDEDRSVAEVSMHIYNERLTIPVILYSAANLSPAALLRFNIVGRVEIPTPWIPGLGVEPIFNYLSNIVATGRAFPNN
ncbi:MAG: response regulator, partial [Elusimicrobiaceae bacterium]|nr:response regulator [Elusimicrobiaceae bacterium]